MALLDFLVGKRKKPMQAAQPYFQQAQQLFQPYQQPALEATGLLGDVTSQLARDPAGYLENIMKGYQLSPQAQMQQEQALKAAGAAAAAGGIRGTQQDLMRSARIADLVQSEDMQRYLQNILGVQQTGLAGQEALVGRGMQAAGQQAGIFGTQAGMAAQQAQEANRQRQQILGALGGLAGGAVGAYFGGVPGMTAGLRTGSTLGQVE